jgi:hypothetical protein
MNNKCLIYVTNFNTLPATLEANKDLLEEINLNIKNFIIINSSNIIFFSEKKKFKINEFGKYKFFNPLTISEFENFLSENNVVASISNFGRDYGTYNLHRILTKFNVPQIIISNLGNIQMSFVYSSKNLILTIQTYFIRVFFKKIIHLLVLIKHIAPIEIRFITDKFLYNNLKKKSFKNFFCKYFYYTKEIILVNSRSYDFFLKNDNLISEEYIVHLDAFLNYKEETQLRGHLNSDAVKNHYFYLEKFLKKLSIEFKKEVIVCIHPLYNLEHHQFYLKDFKIVKFRTREFIYKSYIVTTFDSSAICDAIMLKKKIIGLESNYMTLNEIKHAKYYSKKVGYMFLNTKSDYHFSRQELLKKLSAQIINYEDYLNNNHIIDLHLTGSNKIVAIIKKRYNL